jgi:hypothetical protein
MEGIFNKVQLVGRPEINLELAVGQRSLKLRELDREVDKFVKSKEEDKQIVAMCNIIAEFSDIKSGEEARAMLTDNEILHLYLAIKGDIETTKTLFTISRG